MGCQSRGELAISSDFNNSFSSLATVNKWDYIARLRDKKIYIYEHIHWQREQ